MSSSSSDKSRVAANNADGGNGKAVRISRREFGMDAAVAAALTLSPTSLLAARRDLDKIAPTSAPGEQEAGTPKLTADQSRDVEAKLANIIRKYGERLSEEQRKHLRRILAYNETMLAPVRAFTLQNGDPPVTVLKLSSGENRK